jgi:hypothetical protein
MPHRYTTRAIPFCACCRLYRDRLQSRAATSSPASQDPSYRGVGFLQAIKQSGPKRSPRPALHSASSPSPRGKGAERREQPNRPLPSMALALVLLCILLLPAPLPPVAAALLFGGGKSAKAGKVDMEWRPATATWYGEADGDGSDGNPLYEAYHITPLCFLKSSIHRKRSIHFAPARCARRRRGSLPFFYWLMN